MRAVVYTEYGPPDVVQVKDVVAPAPRADEVRISVRAASVNPIDWHFMRGMPYFVRIPIGVRKPSDTRLGVDVAGEIDTVGSEVLDFKRGDQVFGTCRGAFAESVCASPAAIRLKPRNLTFAQAASVPLAAVTALQGLRAAGPLQRGQQVLINGAAGGVGTFGVQIAKSFGTQVTGVCSTRNVDLVRSIGADRVVDYTREDFTARGNCYDVILDCVGNRGISECRRVLAASGAYVGVGAPTGAWMIGPLVRIAAARLTARFSRQRVVAILAKSNKEDLATISDLIESGRVTPVVDKQYALEEVSAAIRYLETVHARGKVVIAVSAAASGL